MAQFTLKPPSEKEEEENQEPDKSPVIDRTPPEVKAIHDQIQKDHMLAQLLHDEANRPPTRLRSGRPPPTPIPTPNPIPSHIDKKRPEPLVIPIKKHKLRSFEDKAEESCISMDEIFDMYNPSSNQNRATYFPNDEDKEMDKQIKEKAERKRKRDEKRAEKEAKKAELEREKVERAAKDATQNVSADTTIETNDQTEVRQPPKRKLKYKIDYNFVVHKRQEVVLQRTFWCKSRDAILAQVLVRPKQKVKVVDTNTLRFYEEETKYVYLDDLKDQNSEFFLDFLRQKIVEGLSEYRIPPPKSIKPPHKIKPVDNQ